jgi:hypothetical protein
MELPEAIKTLREALSNDKSEGSYYYAWQANIAMSFYDAYMKEFGQGSDWPLPHEIHKIANNAAKNFLDILISQPSNE